MEFNDPAAQRTPVDYDETPDIEDAVLRSLPADEAALVQTMQKYRPQDVQRALRNLLRTQQIHRAEGRLELYEGAAERAAFRAAALTALAPVLDAWQYLLKDTDVRRELLYAVEGRYRRLRKVCAGCRQSLLRTVFGINTAKPDGLQSRCRACRRKRSPR